MGEELVLSHLWLVLLMVTIWDLAWRGVAMWRSARSGSIPWFVALLLINSAGILPIVYILFVEPRGTGRSQKASAVKVANAGR